MAGGRRRDHLREIRNLSPSERSLIEYTKDSWNADNLVGIRYPDTSSDRWIQFEKVPERFRPLAKQWCQFLLARFSFTHGRERIYHLQFFLNWLLQHDPATTTFADMTANQIDAYVHYCKITPNSFGRERSANQVWRPVHVVRAFLEYLELNTHPLRTNEPVQKVVGAHHLVITWPIHYSHGKIKYIPEPILQQFEQHIQDLPPHYIPLTIVLRATGWRISDVLLLKKDTCLEQTEKGWWVCGDITKTQVLGHRVPVTKEVADVMKAQRVLVEQE